MPIVLGLCRGVFRSKVKSMVFLLMFGGLLDVKPFVGPRVYFVLLRPSVFIPFDPLYSL